MRKSIAGLLAAALVAAPVAARAADWSGCIVGPTDLNHCIATGAPAAALAAVAAPVIAAGAAVTIIEELRRRTEEREPDGTVPPSAGARRANLTLVPSNADPYRDAGKRPTDAAKRNAAKRNAAFEFNETATNVATVVAGAAVLGAIIATIAKKN
jgi:hypothetical protein